MKPPFYLDEKIAVQLLRDREDIVVFFEVDVLIT